jgi:site-specific DNA recombinase
MTAAAGVYKPYKQVAPAVRQHPGAGRDLSRRSRMSEATPAVRSSRHPLSSSSGDGSEFVPVAAAVYVRVSTANQADQDRYGLEAQETACRSYAATHNLRVTGVYTDVISGTKESRSGLEQLLREAPRYRAVIVYAIDRIARNVPLAYKLLDEFQQAGLDVHSSSEGVQSLADDSSALRFGIYAVFADHERRRITKRMYAGQLEKARQGRLVRPIQAYGYKDSEIYEPEAKWVRFIYDSVVSSGVKWVMNRLTEFGVPPPSGNGKWCHSTVRNIINNPTYKGAWMFGRRAERIPVPCAAIVASADWEKAQASLRRRRTHRGRRGSRDAVFNLQGRIRCAHCGYAISGWVSNGGTRKRYEYYICLHRSTNCDHRKSHPIALVHQAVLDGLSRLLDDSEALKQAVSIAPVPARDVSEDIERLRAELARARKGYLADVFSLEEFREAKLETEAKIAALEAEAATPATKPADLSAARERLREALQLGNLLAVVRAADVHVTLSKAGEITLTLGV